MKALVIDSKHKDKSLVSKELEAPVPGEAQVLIKIHATSLNAADYRSVEMGMLPKSGILGSDIAGTVAGLGRGVSRFAIGDRVCADLSNLGCGGLAEYVLAPESALVSIPDGLDFMSAAALPMAGCTALQALRDVGGIQPGFEVLIVGASGGVGSYAVQLARHFGASVTGVCSTANLDLVMDLGAKVLIDYKKEDFTKTDKRFDLILGIQGNYALRTYKKLLRPGGRFVMVGGAISQIFRSLILGPFFSFGSRKIKALMAKPKQGDLELLLELRSKGKIKDTTFCTWPLAEADKAFEVLRTGRVPGKLLILCEIV